MRLSSIGWAAMLGVLVSPGLTACNALSPGAASGASLRLVNVGSRSVEGLVVMFPNEQVEFGNVPGGASTAYRVARNGVFRYAAYQFRVGGRVRMQPVIDWVGEEPMPGRAFTYSIELVDDPTADVSVRLAAATRDE